MIKMQENFLDLRAKYLYCENVIENEFEKKKNFVLIVVKQGLNIYNK